MKKFANLLRKEIKELVNKQLVFTLLFMLILYNFIGQTSKKEVEKIQGDQTISALDLDGSERSQGLLKELQAVPEAAKEAAKALPKGSRMPQFKIIDLTGKTKEQAIEAAKTNDSKLLVVIPKGFGDSLAALRPVQVETYSFMRTFSLIGATGQVVVEGLISRSNQIASNKVLQDKLPDFDPKGLKEPIQHKDYVVVRDRIAEGSAMQVAGQMSKQSMLIPLVLMMIVIYSSQMVISAIAMEKQDKTLETLLTVPIKRTSIITAKMLAAGLVGLISAGIYMVAFRSFFSGMTGGLPNAGDGGAALMQKLGLTFSTTGYIVLGLAMFLAILVALALAMILGVLAEDFRSAQTMIMPVIFLVMIPYFISLFADMNSLSLPIKIVILAIPFTHPFLVSQNLYLGNWGMIAFGLGYMFVIFVVLTVIAARIFSTDKILTMKLRLGKKKAAVA